jgi:hypothetical protein
LLLNLEANHTSEVAQTWLESDQNDLLDRLKFGLQIPAPPQRTKLDESQITSLFRALLELSGRRVDLLLHCFADDYTASENRDLCASVFGIASTKDFGEFDATKMCDMLSKSPVFSGTAISARNLEDWTTKMKNSLRIGFRQGHLVRHPNDQLRPMLMNPESSIASVKRIRCWPGEHVRSLPVSLYSKYIEHDSNGKQVTYVSPNPST